MDNNNHRRSDIIKPQNSIQQRKTGAQPAVSRKSEKAVGRRLTPKRRVRIVTLKQKAKTPFPAAALLAIVTVTVLVLFLMMNYAEIDRYNTSIADMKSQLTDLQKEADKLEQRLDKKNDLVYVEEYATDKLGMVKSTELQRVNVTLIGEDEGKLFKYNDGKEGGLGVLLSGFGEVIRNFFD